MLTQTVAGVIIPDKDYPVSTIAVVAAVLLIAFAFKMIYFDLGMILWNYNESL